MLDRETVRNT